MGFHLVGVRLQPSVDFLSLLVTGIVQLRSIFSTDILPLDREYCVPAGKRTILCSTQGVNRLNLVYRTFCGLVVGFCVIVLV